VILSFHAPALMVKLANDESKIRDVEVCRGWPSLTPSINGIITGALIHATTNPKSLGKAYSNGCIGTSEPDIWSIYYAAPPGTKVKFRYDLDVRDKNGNIKKLKDIYDRKE
jgi:L,D-transpeptidase ErfK/SrfK